MEQQWSQRGYESAEIACNYIKYRPRPPPQLVERIVEFLKEKVFNISYFERKIYNTCNRLAYFFIFAKYHGDLSLCWDVGCGSGQCTVLYSPYFQKVFATDISCSQIETAKSQNYPTNLDFR